VLGKVLITRPVFDEAVEFLKTQSMVDSNPDERVLSKTELIERLRDVRGVMTQLTDTIDSEVLTAAPHLIVVANVAVGFNNIDISAANQAGVLVTNTPGVLTETTADFAWALLMAAARRVAEADKFTRAGQFKTWHLKMLLGYDIYRKTLGIVGFGRIGQSVARRARGFDMEVQYYDPQPPPESVGERLGAKRVSLATLLQTSDFISIHVPLLPETHHLLNDAAFAEMKPNTVVINTSRGPVVDERALARALKSRRIAAAGLDVYEREPLIEPELFELENVVLAPHIASASYETRLRMCMVAAENLVAALKGDPPPNLVNPEAWGRK